jgi:hypothetical protein
MGIFQDGNILGCATPRSTADLPRQMMVPAFPWRPLNSHIRTAAQTSYLLYASDNNQNFKISRLDTNYYNVTAQVNVLTGKSLLVLGVSVLNCV